MVLPTTLVRRYESYLPLVRLVADRVKPALMNLCEEHGYAFTSRFKTAESLIEKVESGRFRSWSDIDDLFACTVIVPSLSEEEVVVDFCKKAFSIKKMTKRGQVRKAPDAFRFDSTRITASLVPPGGLGEASAGKLFEVLFEVQVRSAFDHAWVVAMHNVAYKCDDVDWKRFRLAAQIKAVAEQLDMLVLGFEQSLRSISENPWPETKQKRQIAEMVAGLTRQGRIPSEMAPKDLSRFSDNLYSLIMHSSGEPSTAAAIECIKTELQDTPTNSIPRSTSLFQFFLAILVTRGVIRPPFKDGYVCHVTQELVDLFRDVDTIRDRFDYSA